LVHKDSLLFSTEFARLQSSIIDEPEMKDSNELAPLLDTTCHCLVVDESLVPAGDMKEAMAKILSTTIQSAVEAQGRELLRAHIPPNDISSIYVVRESKTVHVNFVSLGCLAAALLKFSFLVRCGSTRLQSKWSYTRPCGPPRDKVVDLIRFFYTCPAAPNLDVAAKDMEAKLKQLGILYTRMDMRTQPIDETRRGRGSNAHRVSGALLPRDVSTDYRLSSIRKLHGCRRSHHSRAWAERA
jgi:hypothetical protein